jgi:hypothetical protein
LQGSRIERGRAARAVFPPEQIAEVKAIACALPRTQGVPLSRFSRAELHRLVVERGVCEASASTIARWLAEDALKPWQHRSWSFPQPRPRPPARPCQLAHQLEIYFSIVQRTVLEPNGLDNLAAVARTLNDFERHWNEIAEPFDRNFTRDDLAALIERLTAHGPQLQLAA